MGQTNLRCSNQNLSGMTEEMFEYSSSTKTEKEGRFMRINFVIFQEFNDLINIPSLLPIHMYRYYIKWIYLCTALKYRCMYNIENHRINFRNTQSK